MKIIAHTATGYLVEIQTDEVSKITGNSDDYHYQNSRFKVGTEFALSQTWNHLSGLLSNEDSRKRIAESLRAAATLIEHTPSPIILPTPPDAIPAPQL